MPPCLKSVDQLTITFLVDNCIEWMTKLPPGFEHELQQHLKQDGHGTYDEEKGVPVLDFDRFCCGSHGFAALIETTVDGEESHLTLFDTGPDSLSLVRNLDAMEVPIDKIERVITSHWHSDHTGDVHPDRPIARGIAPGPTYDKVLCALPLDPTFESIEQEGGIIERHSEGHYVAGDTAWVSGEIPRVTEYEIGILGGMRWTQREVSEGKFEGSWIKDGLILDERYAAVDVKGKGLVIFSACSHAGIVNVIRDAIDTFKRPIYMIIGGLHLAGPEFGSRIPMTIDFLAKKLRPSPIYILPMHCTGFQAKIALEHAFGDGCVPAGVGLKVDIPGDNDSERNVFPPTYQVIL